MPPTPRFFTSHCFLPAASDIDIITERKLAELEADRKDQQCSCLRPHFLLPAPAEIDTIKERKMAELEAYRKDQEAAKDAARKKLLLAKAQQQQAAKEGAAAGGAAAKPAGKQSARAKQPAA